MRVLENGLYIYKNKTPFLEYHEAIESGEIKASYKVAQVMKHLKEEYYNEESEYYYDEQKAMHPITFIENFLFHFKGAKAGEPFILDLWQRAILSAFFGFISKKTERRRFTELLLMVARKNGKSTLASAIAVYMQFVEGERSPSIVSVATKRDQARLVFDVSKQFIKHSPQLRGHAKLLTNEIVTDYNDGKFQPLSSEANSLDGLDVSLNIHDELHAYRDNNLFSVVVDGTSAREQPVTLITTTNGVVRGGIFDIKYEEAGKIIRGYEDDVVGYRDDKILPFIYELDKIDEWKKEENWEKANPAIETVKNKETLRNKVHQALHNPAFVNNLVTKDFNVASSDTNAWLTFEELNNTETFSLEEMKPRYGILGVDLSKTTDLTSANLLFVDPNDPSKLYTEHMYWLPSDALEKRVHVDKVPYDVWYQQGKLRVSEGSIVDYEDIIDWVRELRDKHGTYILYAGIDSWNGAYFIKSLAAEIGSNAVIEVRQGAKTLSAPMYELEELLKNKQVNYNNNPLTKMCIANTHVKMDTNGNIQPTKAKNGQRMRIDGLASLLNSFTVFKEKEAELLNLIT